jgi:serine/threonine protein kinase/tetratricopeptide (TPR) repeat protein
MHATPRLVDRIYLLHEKLAEGGMGTVYRATPRAGGGAVALKLIRLEKARNDEARYLMRLSLAREFQLLSSLHHPHIVHVLDYGFDEQLGPYLTMELLQDARDLRDAARGRPLEQQIELLAQVLRALSYLHRRGVIHCDLKPGNVLCVGDHVRLVDFGLAMRRPERGQVAGTHHYMAPEIFAGEPPSVASDLYAFGALAQKILADTLKEDDTAALSLELLASTAHGATPLPAPPATPEREKAADLPAAAPLSPEDARQRDRVEALRGIVRRLLSPRAGARPASAAEVLEELSAALGMELPVETALTRESFLSASEMVGREAESARLESALAHARHGKGSAWIIGGESGVGKSRLLAELRTVALVQGACVAQGQAVAEGSRAFEAWLPVLRALWLRAGGPDADAAVLKELLPDLPEIAEHAIPDAPLLPFLDAETRLFEAIIALFRRQSRPTVVIVEDLQWAAGDSVRLFERIARIASELPLLLVGSYRDDEAPDLAAALPDARPMKLHRLGKGQIARLGASMLGPAGESPEIVEYLCRETEGNVFFLVEIIRALAEQAGRLDRVGRIPLPEHVLTGDMERIVRGRIDRVPKDGRALLDLAAALGQKLDLDVLRALSPGVDLEVWLTACVNASVLSPQAGEFRFAHDKLREAILSDMAPPRRRALHGRIARAMEALCSGREREERSAVLAYHFQEAGEPDLAARSHVRAGARSTRLCLYGDARAHYQAAMAMLHLLPATPEIQRRKVDVLIDQIFTTLGAEEAEQNFERAKEARALLDGLAKTSALTPEDRHRLARVDYFTGRVHFYRGETDLAIEHYLKVLPATAGEGDDEIAGLASCLVGTAVLIRGNAADAEPLLARSIGPVERQGGPFEWFRAVGYHGLSLMLLGRFHDGEREIARILSRARSIRQPNVLSASYIMTGCCYLVAGDWPTALSYFRDARGYASQTGDKLYQSLAWSGVAWAQSQLGMHEEAMSARQRAMEVAQTMGGRVMLDDWYRAADAEMALNADHVDHALSLARAVVEQSEPRGLLMSEGIAQRVWGEALLMTGHPAAGNDRMARSVTTLERGGLLSQSARTRLRWALALRRRGQRTEAELAYRKAHEALSRFGCKYALMEAECLWVGEPRPAAVPRG